MDDGDVTMIKLPGPAIPVDGPLPNARPAMAPLPVRPTPLRRPLRRRHAAFLTLLVLAMPWAADGSTSPVPADQFTPDWFFELAMEAANPGTAKSAQASFRSGDFARASASIVGSGLKASDQALAQGAVFLGEGAEALLRQDDRTAREAFQRCVESAVKGEVTAEDPLRLMRASLLHARCLSVLPDRQSAALVLKQTAGQLSDPEFVAEFLFGAGRLQEDLGNYLEAEKLFQSAHDALPDGDLAPHAIYARVLVHGKSGRWKDVPELAEEVAERYPQNRQLASKCQVLAGQALVRMGDTARAQLKWRQLTNAFATRLDDKAQDSNAVAEAYWWLGNVAAARADSLRFTDSLEEARREAHARRREHMQEAFDYYREAIAFLEYPWTPAALRDIGKVIESYARAVAGQRIQYASDTARVAAEVVIQQKLPSILRSAGNIYRRQLKLAAISGDGMGIAQQSGAGLARTWYQAMAARRAAAEILARSPRPLATPAGLAWYQARLDSAVEKENKLARKEAREGLEDLASWGQLAWPEADSLRAFLGGPEADSAIARGSRRDQAGMYAELAPRRDLDAQGWQAIAQDLRRQSREVVLDIRILRARVEGN